MKGRQMYTIPRQGSGESGSGYSVRSDDLRSVSPLSLFLSPMFYIRTLAIIGIRLPPNECRMYITNINIYLKYFIVLFIHFYSATNQYIKVISTQIYCYTVWMTHIYKY